MADVEKPKRKRKGPRKSRFTDASPERKDEENRSDDMGPNVSSTESEDSDVEAIRKVQDIARLR